MGRFTYEAMDGAGRRLVDTGDARSREDMLISLQSRGLVLLRWMDEKQSGRRLFQRKSKTLKNRELLQLTREMAHLLKSGLPMDRAFTVVTESVSERAILDTAVYLKESIQGGSSLSEAMAARPADFNNLYVNMIRVGEMGGILPQVMEKLGSFLERTEEIKRFILSSSIYPAILMFVGFVSIFVIMGVVIPRFATIFNDLGQKIPTETRILIEISEFLRAWWWAMLAGAAGSVLILWRLAKSPYGKEKIDGLLIRVPALGSLLLDIQVGRFARTLGTLVQSGVPILKALSIVREVVGNRVVKDAVEYIYQQVKEGKKISRLMKDKGIFPPMAVQMVSLGEETGRIGEMLVVTADELDDKIQIRIKSYLSMLEPVAILVMGVIIGGIVVSMLSAILGINEIEF